MAKKKMKSFITVIWDRYNIIRAYDELNFNSFLLSLSLGIHIGWTGQAELWHNVTIDHIHSAPMFNGFLIDIFCSVEILVCLFSLFIRLLVEMAENGGSWDDSNVMLL